MTRTLKREVLVDTGKPEGGTHLDLQLVHPIDAIQWIATGKFYSLPVEPVRPWPGFLDVHGDGAVEREQGAIDLATLILTAAIQKGQARCAFVSPSTHQTAWDKSFILPKLEVIPPSEFAEMDVSESWDDGFSLQVQPHDAPDDDREAVLWVENFLLFWDEVAALAPWSKTPAGPDYAPPPPGAGESRQARASTLRDRGRSRGPKGRTYGGPVARFLARAERAGLAEAVAEHNDTLGQWLIEEYQARGDQKLPHIDNAKRDAREALTEWIASRAE